MRLGEYPFLESCPILAKKGVQQLDSVTNVLIPVHVVAKVTGWTDTLPVSTVSFMTSTIVGSLVTIGKLRRKHNRFSTF